MSDKKTRRTRGAQLGNENAKKGEDIATSFLHVRCTPKDKATWVRKAQSNGGLSEWVTKTLNNAANVTDHEGL